MHRRFTRNPRLRFIEEPSDQDGGSGSGETGTEPPEGKGEAETEGEGEQDEDEGDRFDPARALAKIKKLNSEAANLRAAKKAAEEKAAGVDQKDSRIKALEAENMRIRIGARHGLPDELIDRLKGDTEEEILADAEKLLGFVSGSKKTPPTRRPSERPGGDQPDTDSEEKDVRKLGARMFQR